MLCKFITKFLGCLACSLVLCSSALAVQQADFSWLPNQEANLAGYKIYYSTVSSQYDQTIDVGNPGIINGVVQTTVTGLEDGGTYYFAATAYDADGFESDYSQEVVWTSPIEEPISPPPPVVDPVPPVASDLSLSIPEDTIGTGQLNGQSSSGLSLTYQIVTNGSKGTGLITDSGAGTFSYTPQANFNGVDTFSYKISDANGESTVATVTITITSVNDAPIVNEQLVFTNEDQVLMGSLTGHDLEGDSLTYTMGSNASNGSVIINADGSYSYMPAADFNGSDSFTFKAYDGSLYSNSAAVSISINSVNDVPVAYDDAVSVQENQTVAGILHGSDIDSDQLTYSIVSNGVLGTATIGDQVNGAYTYTPNEGTYGEDTFQFVVSDSSIESTVATVAITITSVNDAPTADEQEVFTNEDQVLMGSLMAHDEEGDSLTYTMESNAGNGSVIINADGSFSYTPDADFNGSDSFTFQAHDGSANSNSATVNISINPVNDVPVAYDDAVDVQENQTMTGILQGSDIDSDQLTYSIVSNGILGTATIVDQANGAYTYTPNEGAYGEDAFQFVVNDGSGESNQATVSIRLQQAAPSFAMEIGELTVDGTWSYVSFTETFQDPVVVAKPASSNDPSPCVVRIRNLTSAGFEIRLQQFDYLAEEHGVENLGYIAVERGSFVLENGKRVEAGIFNTNATDYPETVTFSEQFPVMPVVAASIVTENEYDAVVSRVGNVTENGFDYQMQEQEANNALHTFEYVAYIAWEPFAGLIGDFAFEIQVHQEEVNDQWHSVSFQQGFDKRPVLIAGTKSNNGSDTANLRHTELKANGVRLKVAEEQSVDSETGHVFEAFSFMAISDIDLDGDADLDGLVTWEERDIYGTSPGENDSDIDGIDDGAEVNYWGSAWDTDIDNDGLVNLLDPDSDNDGYMDGEEVDLGYDPSDASSNPDVVVEAPNDPVNIITLDVNAYSIKRRKIVELFWSGASGSSALVKRVNENGETTTKTVSNENYYKEKLRSSGVYTYQVCETDGSVCSDAVTVEL